jgi:fructosamine-3-kinase
MLWLVDTDAERRAFVEAYVDSWPLRPGAEQRLTLYALSDWLVVWAYGKRHGTWVEDASFLDRIGPIVANARTVASIT